MAGRAAVCTPRRTPRPLRVLAIIENDRVPLNKIAWLVTVLACLVTSLLLVISGYQGYAGVALAVGASAAINLR